MCERCGFRTVNSAGLGEDVAQVVGNRVETDEQFVGNLPIAFAGSEEAQHLGFALRESGRVDDTGSALLSLRA
jgi:hypothetical protein